MHQWLSWVQVFAICIVLPTTWGHVPFHDWQCGSEDTSRRYAYDTIYEKCPTLAAELNHCCVVHDECYVRQLGQDLCDKEFCQCNDRILNRTGSLGADCRLFTNTICTLMPFMGIFAYDNSVNYTEPVDLPKYLPHNQELQEPFVEMYSSCSKVNSTTSSCTIIWNNCMDDDYFCGAQLCSCVEDAYRLDHEPECLHTVKKICSITMKDRQVLHEFFTNPIIIVVICLAITALGGLFYYLYRRDKDEATLIKYTTVIEA